MSSTSHSPAGEVVVQVFGRTDVGRTREHNEDAFVVADLSTDNATLQPEVRRHVLGPKGSLFMVADGMGGAAAGEIASAMAVDIVLEELRNSWIADPATSKEAFVRAIKQATKTANERINAFAAHHPEFRGMGTTATVAGLLGDTLYLSQVGDSRAYLVRDGVARQITKDQSLMQKLIEAGELTEEEAEHSERRNIILQALGPEPTIKIDLTHQAVRQGDTLVLCSDGLSGQVTKDDIATVIREESDLTVACKRLIDIANANGGPDNITVIIVRFEGSALQPAVHDDPVGHRVFPLAETGQTPATPFERVVDVDAETLPFVKRPSARRDTQPSAGVPTSPPALDLPMVASLAPEPDAPSLRAAPVVVSPARRNVGSLIAMVLLALLVAAGAWFVVRHVGGAPDSTSTTAPRS